ncbi:MAG TPA: ATP synthase subunit I [Deltaproteobacteria bacterium]|nr:ATP synthase subunit I [Deltaproteobacteria bacterium]
METARKDPVQRRIEFIAYTFWAAFCIVSLPLAGADFALGVLLGGAVCLGNYQLLWRHARSSVTFPAKQGSAYMIRRYVLRLAITGAVLYVLIAVLHVNVLGLLVGLSVIMLGVMSYACYTYICAGGH